MHLVHISYILIYLYIYVEISVCLYVNHNSNSVIETRKFNIIYINTHSFIKRRLLLDEEFVVLLAGFTGSAVYQQQFLKDYPQPHEKKTLGRDPN